MYLKSLALKGFKSFADRTLMSFDPGLTVVVGPNGSGKSNIADAMLWVLGEQSAKMLRGQAMEDVIFSGSSGRSAVSLAEVTLTLDNADHTLPIDFSEIAITRRMYRSGESEYLINGALSRLRDITDILHDSGLGKDTHSIISQGKLDSVLSSRPEERRELIEEAAGISKHRRRKLRSERKIATMQDNLTRAKDIQREINRQLRPLERQVDKAKRHRDLADELSRLNCTLAVDDLRRLQESYGVLEGRGREAEAAIELAQYRLDEKGRLILPARFREELAGGVILTRGQERCLYVFTTAEFERMYAQLREAPLAQRQARDYVRVMLSGADPQIPDRQGRITLPAPLRAYAGLDRDLAVIGAGTRVEIWDAGAWQAYLAAQEQVFAETAEEIIPGFF